MNEQEARDLCEMMEEGLANMNDMNSEQALEYVFGDPETIMAVKLGIANACYSIDMEPTEENARKVMLYFTVAAASYKKSREKTQ